MGNPLLGVVELCKVSARIVDNTISSVVVTMAAQQ